MPALWNQPSRPDWQPGGGGLCLHSISTWPGDPNRLAVAVSAAGMWLTEDAGRSWRRGNRGLGAALPAGGPRRDGDHRPVRASRRARPVTARAAVHAVSRGRLPLRRWRGELGPDRLRPALRLRLPAEGRPGRSGQRLRDPARRRHGPGHARGTRARLRDTRRRRELVATRGGPTGQARLPHGPAPSLHQHRAGERLELYFGATSGDVFGSGDAGASWCTAATRLPPVFSVAAS